MKIYQRLGLFLFISTIFFLIMEKLNIMSGGEQTINVYLLVAGLILGSILFLMGEDAI